MNPMFQRYIFNIKIESSFVKYIKNEFNILSIASLSFQRVYYYYGCMFLNVITTIFFVVTDFGITVAIRFR